MELDCFPVARLMTMILRWLLSVALFCAGSAAAGARAELIFSNLNTSPSATVGSGFTNYAQRITTVSAGTGLQLDLNLVSLTGTQGYSVELWTTDVAGTNVGSFLTTIGSGAVMSADRTAVTSFDLTYDLEAATDYFVKIVSNTGSLGLVLGPSSSTELNSVLRYGVGNLNNVANSSAFAMQVDVVTVPEPGTMALAGMAVAFGSAGAWLRRRRRSGV